MSRRAMPRVTVKDVEAAVHSWVAEQAMRDLSDYVARGRRFEALPENALADRWVSRMQLWADIPAEYHRDIERDDLHAEFRLRGLELPEHRVGEAVARIIAAADRAMLAMSQEARDQFNEDVMGFRAQEVGRAN